MRKIIIFIAIVLSSCQPVPSSDFEPVAFHESTYFSDHNFPSWTIMVYMNADNSLWDDSYNDINEMEAVSLRQNVNIIVFWDGGANGDSKIIEITRESENSSTITSKVLIELSEVNMLTSGNLEYFLGYAQGNYPADHYAVVFWSHSDGWRGSALSRGLGDDGNNGGTVSISLGNEIMSQTLKNKNIDVAYFDACSQGTLEMLWAFKKHVPNIKVIASPNEVPGAGANYTLLLKNLQNSYFQVSDFTKAAVDAYAENYSNYSERTLVVYDLKNFDSSLITNFFNWVNTDWNSGAETREKVLFSSTSVPSFEADFKDFYSYVQQGNYPNKSSLLTMLSNTMIYGWKTEVGFGYKGLGVAELMNTSSYIIPSDYASIALSADNSISWYDILVAWGY